jgi:hypothetical protein
LRAALIADEPFAPLRGDLSSWSAIDRASLVKSLLDAVECKRVTDSPYANAEAYAKLEHSGLAAELRPVITDGRLGVTTRRLAPLIAEKCKVTELQPDLLEVALDATDHPAVRAGAVSALKHCGDASVPALVRPLAAGDGGPDPQCDIKGKALDLLWPDHLAAADLFPLLTPSADKMLIWSGFSPFPRGDQTRHRVSISRPCSISSNARSWLKTSLILMRYTPRPSVGRRYGRDTLCGSTAFDWIPRKPRRPGPSRS